MENHRKEGEGMKTKTATKPAVVLLKLAPEFKADLEAAAQAEQMPLTVWIRTACLEKLRREKSQ